MLGRLAYQFRSTLKHGVSTAWYRDVVRKRILKSSPIEANDNSDCEIHVMTSDSDWLNLMWALKSFYHASERQYALCIHDDGTLSAEARDSLRQHFPQARLLDRSTAEQDVLNSLQTRPRCHEFRSSNHLSPKVFDFRHYLNADRMLLLDSDVLFFREPSALLSRIEDDGYRLNSVNADVDSAYTVDPNDIQERFGFELVGRFNSGLGVIHKDSLNLDWIEEFLGVPGIVGHFWRIEQTLYALCSCRYGVELLPDTYDVFLEGPLKERQSRHYVGPIRHLMYSEGIRQLARVSQQW
ncbi:MAG TPA: hypothetical protein DDW52_26060 [Planctomycetaceae bacterium]|nr:hypothetical protein [Planctomycetaceae bacterium]